MYIELYHPELTCPWEKTGPTTSFRDPNEMSTMMSGGFFVNIEPLWRQNEFIQLQQIVKSLEKCLASQLSHNQDVSSSVSFGKRKQHSDRHQVSKNDVSISESYYSDVSSDELDSFVMDDQPTMSQSFQDLKNKEQTRGLRLRTPLKLIS